MTDLFIGSPIEHESERVVLERILDLLAHDGRPAVILANVTLKERQIDFIVGLNDLALVIEAKGFTRPVRGSENGPWQVQVSSGGWKNFRSPSNPYIQARDAAYDLKDTMRLFAGGEPPYPAAAVVFVPGIPQDSDVCAGDFKVLVTGLDGLEAALRQKRKGAWRLDYWTSLARRLGLAPVGSLAAACDEQLAEAEALLQQYSDAYTRIYDHPVGIVPFECRSGDKGLSSEAAVRLVAEKQADVLIQGPSGCGKSLLAGQAGRIFSQSGGIVVTIPVKNYSGGIKAVLDREVGLLCDVPASKVLGAAKRLNRPLLFIADGYNECAASDRPLLTKALDALARKYEANLLITSQCPLARADLLPLQTVEVPLATAETKAAIALNIVGGDVLPNELEQLLSAVSTGLEAKLIGEVGGQLNSGGSRFAMFDAFVRKRLDNMASEGIRLLARIAGRLSEHVAFSLSVRDLDRLADFDRESQVAARQLQTVGLLTRRGDRVSFAHEMFFHAFAAEDVVRRAAGCPVSLLTALASPLNAERKAFIIGAIDDDLFRVEILEGLEDAQSISACLSGECGNAAQEWAEARCSALWKRLRAEILSVSCSVSDQGWWKITFDPATLATWTASERAQIAAIPQRIVEGYYLDEVLDTIGVLDTRIAEEEARLRDDAQEHEVPLRSSLFANAYVRGLGPDGALGITRICSDLHGRLYRTVCSTVIRAIQRKLEADNLSHGQVYFLLMLSRGSNVAAPLIVRTLETRWVGAPYHLRLDLLDAVQMCCRANDVDRAALITALEELPQTSNVFISSAILEALQALGALEDSEHEHIAIVWNQVRYCLANPQNADNCATAYSLYAFQFDHPYSGAYSQVIADLPENERVVLLTMAANGVDETSFFLVPLLMDLASSGDFTVGDSIARFTTLPPADSVMPQDSIAVFVAAHIALARFGCPLPNRRDEANSHSAEALVACGEVLYWCNRIDLDEVSWRRGCEAPVSLLVQLERGAALNVIHLCEEALVQRVDRPLGESPVYRSSVQSFSIEAIAICRHALTRPENLIGYFRHYFDFHRQRDLAFAINVLSQYGNSTDSQLLREYANDTFLGKTAIAALRKIEERQSGG